MALLTACGFSQHQVLVSSLPGVSAELSTPLSNFAPCQFANQTSSLKLYLISRYKVCHHDSPILHMNRNAVFLTYLGVKVWLQVMLILLDIP